MKFISSIIAVVFVTTLACTTMPAAGMFGGRRLHGFQHILHHDQQLRAAFDAFNTPIEDSWFNQEIDHFDRDNYATFKQRYWINSQYWDGSGPVFVSINGEGAASAYTVQSGHMVEIASRTGALVLSLEHRYYGASVPTPTMSTEDLKYLSAEQALADLASFLSAMSAKLGYDFTANPVVTFGGSYAGALTAWSRIKYPHIVYAAVSSSGPVHAVADFRQYNEVIGASLATPLVGGSTQCESTITKAFTVLQSMLTSSSGRQQLSSMFNTCQPLDGATVNDTNTFVMSVAGTFEDVVQYNNQLPGLNVDAICKYMLNASTPLEGLVAITGVQNAGNCVDISYADANAGIFNTTVDRGATGVGIRQWTYQTASEFGYLQSCEADTTCPFDAVAAFSYQGQLDVLEQAFQINAAEFASNIAFSNLYYGSNHPAGSRIIYVNGHVDPWHALSVLESLSNEQVAVFIEGTSHCQNMQPTLPTDPPALTAARQKIDAQLTQWLKAAQHTVGVRDFTH
jgi:thymus-specific serine protease